MAMTRTIEQANEFLRQLCQLAGEDPAHVKSITVHAAHDKLPVVTIERVVRLQETEPK